MTEDQRIHLLKDRLRALELRIPTSSERSILEIARQALEDEICAIGQRLARRRYWRPAPPKLRAS